MRTRSADAPRWSRSRTLGVAAVVASLLLPLVASAQGRNQFLEEGKELIAKGKPADAVEELERALLLPELPTPQRVEILGWLGAALHLAGREDDATERWEERVRIAPEAPFPKSLPAGVRSAYASVQAGAVVIEHLPPPGAFAGRPLSLLATVVDRFAGTRELVVYHRRAGERSYQVTPFRRDAGDWVAQLTPPPLVGSVTSYVMEYYLVAQGEEGEVLHQLGGASEPLTVRVVAPAVSPEPEVAVAPVGPTRERPPVETVDAVTEPRITTDPSVTEHRTEMPEVIAAVEVDVDDTGRRRRRGRVDDAPGRMGKGAWVWITLGAVAAVVAVGAGIAAATAGDPVPTTSLGVIEYPLEDDR